MKTLREMTAKEFIEVAGCSIDEGRSHWDVHEEINRRILEAETLKLDLEVARRTIVYLDKKIAMYLGDNE